MKGEGMNKQNKERRETLNSVLTKAAILSLLCFSYGVYRVKKIVYKFIQQEKDQSECKWMV